MRVRRQAIVDVLAYPMVPLTTLAVRVNVNRDASEMGEVMEEPVADLLGDLVALGNRETAGHGDVDLRMQPVTDPARPNVGDVLDAGNVSGGVDDLVHGLGLDAV